MTTTKPMGKRARAEAAESCLARILDAWVPAVHQGEWCREAPNAHSTYALRREPMTTNERALILEHTGGTP